MVLTLLSTVTAVTAVVQRSRAEKQTRIAVEQKKVATAGELLARAQASITADPRTALQLGEAAQRVHTDPETRFGLARLVRSTRYAGTTSGHAGAVTSVAFAPDGSTLATGSADGGVILWDPRDRAHPRRIDVLRAWEEVTSVAFEEHGRTACRTPSS